VYQTTIIVLSLLAVCLAGCSSPSAYGGSICNGPARGTCIDIIRVTMSATPATVDMSAVRAQVAAGVASLDSAGNSSMCICEERYKGNMREERRKNGFWAAAISLTFGLFGMDCFYLGRTGEGIAKLFFGAFSAVILVGGAAAVIAIFNTRKVELFGPVSVECTAVFALLFSIVGFFLWLVYAILIMSNKLYDGSGASLYWGIW